MSVFKLNMLRLAITYNYKIFQLSSISQMNLTKIVALVKYFKPINESSSRQTVISAIQACSLVTILPPSSSFSPRRIRPLI